MTTPEYKLHYFDGGNGEQIRLFFHYNKIKFEDIKYTWEEWLVVKKSGFAPFDALPMLEVDGKRYVQSLAILRMLCQQTGQYPSFTQDVYRVSAVADFVVDFNMKYYPSFLTPDKEKGKTLHDQYFSEHFPVYLTKLEALFNDYSTTKDFFVGDRITMADFAVMGYLLNFVQAGKESATKALDAVPVIRDYFNRRSAEVKGYLDAKNASKIEVEK